MLWVKPMLNHPRHKLSLTSQFILGPLSFILSLSSVNISGIFRRSKLLKSFWICDIKSYCKHLNKTGILNQHRGILTAQEASGSNLNLEAAHFRGQCASTEITCFLLTFTDNVCFQLLQRSTSHQGSEMCVHLKKVKISPSRSHSLATPNPPLNGSGMERKLVLVQDSTMTQQSGMLFWQSNMWQRKMMDHGDYNWTMI